MCHVELEMPGGDSGGGELEKAEFPITVHASECIRQAPFRFGIQLGRDRLTACTKQYTRLRVLWKCMSRGKNVSVDKYDSVNNSVTGRRMEYDH